MGAASVLAVAPLAWAEGARRKGSGSAGPRRRLRPHVPRLRRAPAPATASFAVADAPLPGRQALGAVIREWWPRLLVTLLIAYGLGVALPALQDLDERSFAALQGLGQGPQWLFEALDPHQRNYALLVVVAMAAAALMTRRARYVAGAGLLMVLAGFASDAVLEPFQFIFDRARPQEALPAEATTFNGKDWGHIPSYPSGHLMVTAAMAAAAIAVYKPLRWVLVPYVAAVAITRVTFGAHFPLDVLVGGVIGWEVGLLSGDLVRAAGLLPASCRVEPCAEPRGPEPEGVPQPVGVTR
jgi:membrane-associated phospholipid phosphatase